MSIISLVLGILSVTLCWVGTGIPAVITGHLALNQIKRDPVVNGGRGMALAGLVMGYISIAVLLVAVPAAVILPGLAKAKHRATQAQCMQQLKQVTSATVTYAQAHEQIIPTSFAVLSNQLASPRLLVCPHDRERQPAADWASFTEEDTTYRILAGGLKMDKPQTPIIRCSAHGTFGLTDGSVVIKGKAPKAPEPSTE